MSYNIFNLVSCDPPTNLQGTPLSATEYEVSFTLKPCKHQGAFLYFYYRVDSGDISRDWKVIGLTVNETSLTVPDLLPAVPYKGYLMMAFQAIGNGPSSEVIHMITPKGRKCSYSNLVSMQKFSNRRVCKVICSGSKVVNSLHILFREILANSIFIC